MPACITLFISSTIKKKTNMFFVAISITISSAPCPLWVTAPERKDAENTRRVWFVQDVSSKYNTGIAGSHEVGPAFGVYERAK